MEFEKKLARLEELVQKMEKADLSLEDSLKFFEEGVRLSRECQGQLADAENKVKILMGLDDQGKPITKDFDVTNEG
jgi:exodeoxyribonuclease VII small subunit